MPINSVVIGGRLTKDPELKMSNNGKNLCNFTIAVNEGKDHPASFFNCTAFGITAENMQKYLAKGSQVAVTGKLQQRKYTDKNGQNRESISILANDVTFLDSRENRPQAGNNGGYGYGNSYGNGGQSAGGYRSQPASQQAQRNNYPNNGYAQPAPQNNPYAQKPPYGGTANNGFAPEGMMDPEDMDIASDDLPF